MSWTQTNWKSLDDIISGFPYSTSITYTPVETFNTTGIKNCWDLTGEYTVVRGVPILDSFNNSGIKFWVTVNDFWTMNLLKPSSITYNPYIPGAARGLSNLTSVSIPSSVQYIDYFSFWDTQLTNVTIASDCIYQNSSFPQNCIVNIVDYVKWAVWQQGDDIARTSSTLTAVTDKECLLLACAMHRDTVSIVGTDWTKLVDSAISDPGGFNQSITVWYKTVSAGSHEITVNQSSEKRLSLKLVALYGAASVSVVQNTTIASVPFTPIAVGSNRRLYLISSTYAATSGTPVAITVSGSGISSLRSAQELRFSAFYDYQPRLGIQPSFSYYDPEFYNTNYMNILVIDIVESEETESVQTRSNRKRSISKKLNRTVTTITNIPFTCDSEYYIDSQINYTIDDRSYQKYNSEPAVGMLINADASGSPFGTQLFLSPVSEEAVRCFAPGIGTAYAAGSITYNNKTWWYCSADYGMFGSTHTFSGMTVYPETISYPYTEETLIGILESVHAESRNN